MDASTKFDTTCPSCNQTFEIEATAAEGNCPFCQTHLRFLEEAPLASTDAPTLAPASDAAPTYAPVTSSLDPKGPQPTVVVGGLGVTCPVCATSFHAGPNDDRGSCPGCGASVVYENLFTRGPESFPVSCPGCGQGFEVAARASAAVCPGCSRALALADVFPGDDPATAATLTPTTPTPPADAPAEPMPIAPAAATDEIPPSAGRGRFRRFGKSTARDEAADVSPSPSGSPPRALEPPPQGLPYVLSCPTCNKEFSVAPKEREGNCPHCNAPLAFLSDKEYDALKEAEERKKVFQAKLAQRRLEKKKRDEARLAEEAERRARREAAGPSVLSARLPGILKPKKKPDSPSAAPEGAPPAAPDMAPPGEKPKAGIGRLFGRKTKPVAAPATTEAATVDLTAVAAPLPATEPMQSPLKKAKAAPAAAVEETTVEIGFGDATAAATPASSAKKGLLGPFGRTKKQPPMPAQAATVESTPVDFGSPTQTGTSSARHEALVAAAAELLQAPDPANGATGKKAGKAKKEKPAPDRPSQAQAPPDPVEASIEMGSIDFGGPVEVAAAPAAPSAPKKGFLSRFKKDKGPSAPTATIEPASVEIAGIDLSGTTSKGIDVDSTPAAKKPAARKKR